MAMTCGSCDKSTEVGRVEKCGHTVKKWYRCSVTGKEHSEFYKCDVAEEPRLCQVLGVAVGERFYFDDQGDKLGPLVIKENGQVQRDDIEGIFPHIRFLADAINHPEKIVRLPRLTPEEVQRCRDFGARWVSRDTGSDQVYLWETEPEPQPGGAWAGGKSCAQTWDRFFPSVQPGQLVPVEGVSW